MAHLRDIYVPKCQTSLCSATATVQLYGIRNERYGDYCRKHGAAALRRLEADEKAQIAREQERAAESAAE